MDFRKLMLLLILVPTLALFGCFGEDDPADADEDTTPPAAVGDLIAYDATLNTITLSWTAPGDDGNTGDASTYDIRYSTDGPRFDWATATPLTGEPSPSAPGSQEVWVVQDLDEATEYSFALKTADEVPNWSAASNTAVDTTLGSVIVTYGNSPKYSLVNSNTGDEIAYITLTGLVAVEQYCLGFQGRTVYTIAKAASNWSAVWRCDAMDGAGLVQITDDNTLDVRQFDGNPVAPILALAASEDGTSWENIYTMPEAGGTPTQLTYFDQTFTLGRATVEILGAYEPNWSPDGTQIAFHAQVRDVAHPYPRHHVMCVMDADGGNLTPIYSRQLETATYRSPVWTADGNYVVFIEDNPTYDEGVIFHSMSTGTDYNLWSTLDINATPPRALAMDPWHMRIALYYAFAGTDDVWVADLTTAGDVISASTPVELTDAQGDGHQFSEPDWAPWSPVW